MSTSETGAGKGRLIAIAVVGVLAVGAAVIYWQVSGEPPPDPVRPKWPFPLLNTTVEDLEERAPVLRQMERTKRVDSHWDKRVGWEAEDQGVALRVTAEGSDAEATKLTLAALYLERSITRQQEQTAARYLRSIIAAALGKDEGWVRSQFPRTTGDTIYDVRGDTYYQSETVFVKSSFKAGGWRDERFGRVHHCWSVEIRALQRPPPLPFDESPRAKAETPAEVWSRTLHQRDKALQDFVEEEVKEPNGEDEQPVHHPEAQPAPDAQ